MHHLPKKMRKKGTVDSLYLTRKGELLARYYRDGYDCFPLESPEADEVREQYTELVGTYLANSDTILANNNTETKNLRSKMIKAWLKSFVIASIPANLLCNDPVIAMKVKEWLIGGHIIDSDSSFNLIRTPELLYVVGAVTAVILAVTGIKAFLLRAQRDEMEKYLLYMNPENRELFIKYQTDKRNSIRIETLDDNGVDRAKYILHRINKLEGKEQKRSLR